jgi:pimeloyl-ACP methyl ester carboxylesterase
MNPTLIRNGLRALSFVSPNLAADWAIGIFATPRRIARPPWEQKIAGEGKPERTPEGIAVVRWGDPKAPIVLLVHGWAGRGTQLSYLVEPLLKLGYQVIAFDGPGHGDSRGRRSNIRIFADALVATEKQYGNFRAVVAHSFGAAATILALTRGLQAKAAILVAAPSEVDWIVTAFCRRMGLSSRASKVFRRKISEWAGIPLEDVAIEKIGPKLSLPGLIVHDPEDADVPFENAERYIEHWKQAKLLVLENVGHRKILKAPAFLTAVANFLGPA